MVATEITGRNWRVIVADVLDGLRSLPDESVQCCVTSPPYFGLRDYGVYGQIGLEKTPDEFIARLVEVFREVRRVLRSDGVCFVNMGDSYNNSDKWGGGSENTGKQTVAEDGSVPSWEATRTRKINPPGLKPKDLMGMPWLLAFGLQADCWYLRQDIIWHKRSPMPESVKDRCTKAHEYIFLLTKSAKYFYDAEAVKELAVYAFAGVETRPAGKETPGFSAAGMGREPSGNMKPGSTWTGTGNRNLRSVWTLSAEPFAEAHFATFPSEIPRRCIKAGTSEKGACQKCGTPWVRVTEKSKRTRERPNDLTKRTGANGTGNHCGNTVAGVDVKTTGWQPSCTCNAGEPVPCVVLDPFSGSGTTGMVATELGRIYVGIELNEEYAKMSQRRIESWKTRDVIRAAAPLFGQKILFD